MELTNIKTITTLLGENGFEFKKKFGQNFLINPSVCPKMAALSGADKNTGVLEIGPGIGGLTKELCKVAGKVVAVEIDEKLPPLLEKTLREFDNKTIISGDILKLDLKKLFSEHFSGMDVVVCANLPYYITSPVIMALLEERLPIKSITVMVQKEAAERISAKPGTRECGAISLAIRYFSTPKKGFSVSRGSFMPAPNVDSEVIRLDLNEKPPVSPKSEEMFFKTIKAAFSMRRKTLVNCLSKDFSLPKDTLSEILSSLGISPTARAEELSLEEFASVSDNLFDIIK